MIHKQVKSNKIIIDVEGLKVNAQVISLVIIVTIGSPKFILLSQANLKHV